MGACCALNVPACICKGPPGIRGHLPVNILGDRAARTESLQPSKFIVSLNEQFGDFAEISPATVDAEVPPCGECGAGGRNGIIDVVNIGFVDCDCLARDFAVTSLMASYSEDYYHTLGYDFLGVGVDNIKRLLAG